MSELRQTNKWNSIKEPNASTRALDRHKDPSVSHRLVSRQGRYIFFDRYIRSIQLRCHSQWPRKTTQVKILEIRCKNDQECWCREKSAFINLCSLVGDILLRLYQKPMERLLREISNLSLNIYYHLSKTLAKNNLFLVEFVIKWSKSKRIIFYIL